MLFRIQQNYFAKYLLTISSIVGGYLALVLFDNYSNHNQTTFCFFKLATGIPCPGCGMGRATLELFRGNIAQSFNYNILCIPFTLTIIVSMFWLLADFVQRKETFFNFVKQDIKAKYKVLLFAVIIFNWTTNIIRHI